MDGRNCNILSELYHLRMPCLDAQHFAKIVRFYKALTIIYNVHKAADQIINSNWSCRCLTDFPMQNLAGMDRTVATLSLALKSHICRVPFLPTLNISLSDG